MALKSIKVHGFRVDYDEADYFAIKYLRDDLQYDEAKVFFDQARYKGEAQFEDDREGQWTLQYNRSTGGFLLVKRTG